MNVAGLKELLSDTHGQCTDKIINYFTPARSFCNQSLCICLLAKEGLMPFLVSQDCNTNEPRVVLINGEQVFEDIGSPLV
jgi:hypothetical protein